MRFHPLFIIFVAAGLSLLVFSTTDFDHAKPEKETEMMIANLSQGDTEGFKAIQEAFASRNPGFAVDYIHESMKVPTSNDDRIAFVQTGGGTGVIHEKNQSKVSVGDIIILRAGEGMTTDSALSLLVFKVPEAPPAEIPNFIRPDWDPNITDTPGGCATETNAYRRILLTWLEKVGKYNYHHLNAHRVRIMDSFSHYHPETGGFDEFYLVQMVLPDARIITSPHVDLIEHPEAVTKKQAKSLLNSTPLSVGDLVYLPRGTMHRGIGGVLAQVITVPGFIPGSEIGVDHHLRKINENLSLPAKKALPYNVDASDKAIVK